MVGVSRERCGETIAAEPSHVGIASLLCPTTLKLQMAFAPASTVSSRIHHCTLHNRLQLRAHRQLIATRATAYS